MRMASASESPRYQHQKQLAIRSAASVFAEKGFHSATIRDVASAAGVAARLAAAEAIAIPSVLVAFMRLSSDSVCNCTVIVQISLVKVKNWTRHGQLSLAWVNYSRLGTGSDRH